MTSLQPTDLTRMWGARTWLLAAQCAIQGGQYIAAPQRPLNLATYTVLQPLGQAGWRVIGIVLVVAALTLAAVKSRRVATPEWMWIAGFCLAGTVLTFLCVATLLNHGYLPATLILPAGLCLAELNLIGRLRGRRTTSKERECG